MLAGDERRRLNGVEVIEFGTCLAANLDHVFEARGRHQRGARAASLQERVRSDRSAVDHLDYDSRIYFASDSFQSLRYGARRIIGSGSDFENSQIALDLIYKVGECPARVDADPNHLNFCVAGLCHGAQVGIASLNSDLNRELLKARVWYRTVTVANTKC